MKKTFLTCFMAGLLAILFCSCQQEVDTRLNGSNSFYYDVTGNFVNFTYVVNDDGTQVKKTITEDDKKMKPLFAEMYWLESDNSNYQDYSLSLYYTVGSGVGNLSFTIRSLDNNIFILDETTHRPSSATIKFKEGSPSSSSFVINYVNNDYGISGSELSFVRK